MKIDLIFLIIISLFVLFAVCTNEKVESMVNTNPTAGDMNLPGNLTISSGNTKGSGLHLADDGSIVDNNDGYATMRFIKGIRVTNGRDSDTVVHELDNTGNINSSGNLRLSTGNVRGGGLYLADDGSIVDNNDGYATMRFTKGIRVTNGRDTDTVVHELDNTGNITSDGEIRSKMLTGLGQFRAIGTTDVPTRQSYGTILRNDGRDTFLLLTNKDDPNGRWNGLRPFRISNATGDTEMAHNVTIGGNTFANNRVSITRSGSSRTGPTSSSTGGPSADPDLKLTAIERELNPDDTPKKDANNNDVIKSNHWTHINNHMGRGNYNGITQQGDHGIIFSNNNANSDNPALVIAPWHAGTSGIRITKNDTTVGNALNLLGGNLPATTDSQVDLVNKENVYVRFGESVSGSDFAYLRQIGSDNNFGLALDFHDNGGDANFEIRDIQSTVVTPDVIRTRFKVAGNGDVTIPGNLKISTNNISGGGLFLADDGSIVDNNDGYATMRFIKGIRITDGRDSNNRVVHQLDNAGNITSNGKLSLGGKGMRFFTQTFAPGAGAWRAEIRDPTSNNRSFSSSEWVVIIGGISSVYNAAAVGVTYRTYVNNGTWWFIGEAINPGDERYEINFLAIPLNFFEHTPSVKDYTVSVNPF